MSASSEFVPLNVAVLTLSDTRTEENDTSGDALVSMLREAGHQLAARDLCPDDAGQMTEIVSSWIAAAEIDVILTTGGTGFTGRDSTPEALQPLLETRIDGFGELFRFLSYQEIGSSTIQSRSFGGIANQTLLFCLPGSTGACKTAWNGILKEQLDATHRPCNFVAITRKGPDVQPH